MQGAIDTTACGFYIRNFYLKNRNTSIIIGALVS